MSVCAAADLNGFLVVTAETDCTEFVLVSQVEFNDLESGSLQQMQETLVSLFEFDPVIFGVVEGAIITAFLVSHFGGRVARYLGK